MTAPTVPSAHDLVVEIREGDHIGMRCIPCRSVIAVRPISAAAGLEELNRLGREHCGGPAVPSDEELRGAHQPVPAMDVGAGGDYPRDMCSCGESFYDDCEIRRALDGQP